MIEIEPFLWRALAAAIGLGLLAAPLGSLVIWRRMSYFGSTIAHSGLLGVALGLMLSLNLTLSVLLVAMVLAAVLIVLERQKILPVDSLLGLLSHAALAAGLIASAKLSGQRLDLMAYLFGDIFAVTSVDLIWIYAGGSAVLAATYWLWQELIAIAVHEELAAAEGLNVARAKGAFVLLLAFTIAVAMKIVGILLIIAFLIMPAAAARPFANTPEQMVAGAALIAIAGSISGLYASYVFDLPGGAAIVMMLSAISFLSIAKILVVKER